MSVSWDQNIISSDDLRRKNLQLLCLFIDFNWSKKTEKKNPNAIAIAIACSFISESIRNFVKDVLFLDVNKNGFMIIVCWSRTNNEYNEPNLSFKAQTNIQTLIIIFNSNNWRYARIFHRRSNDVMYENFSI